MNRNLKRIKMWNNIEVHAIYELIYDLCMSKEGLQELKKYFSAKDPNVFEPLFIAQYLLVPVNTIIKKALLPWMIRRYGPPTDNPDAVIVDNRYRAKKLKAELYMKYSLLVDLMNIVKMY